MVKDSYIYILNNPSFIEQQDANEIKSVIEKYPYFQSARALFLKALKEQESFKYNNELKLTAAYTTDRSVLFDFITSELFKKKNEVTIDKKSVSNVGAENTIETIKEELAIGKPIPFAKNETHSFNQWLQLSNGTIQKLEPQKEKSLQDNIIDSFIANSPKISRINKHSTLNTKTVDTAQEPLPMTETLAKIYLEQKKYDNAIKAYEILSLKYPEKSTFFADQIKKIRILQKS